MNRTGTRSQGASVGVPRIRGDEPEELPDIRRETLVFPASAGMNRSRRRSYWGKTGVPRIRGDEPAT